MNTPQDHQSATYTHTFPSGESVTLPRFESVMTFGRARRLRKLDEADQLFTLVEDIADEDTLAVLDKMDTAQTEAFFTGWQEHSGVNLGESSA